jgi:hypothetical protein
MTDTLSNLLAVLQATEAEIDASVEISTEMCERHFQQMASAREKTDRLKYYIEHCKQTSEAFESKYKEFKAESAKWKRRKDSLENYALFCLRKFPEIQWLGSDYELTSRKNPHSLVCPYKSEKSFSNYVPEAYTNYIPEQYLETVEIKLLKTDTIKDDIKSGMKLSFADLEQKSRIVFKPKARELK